MRAILPTNRFKRDLKRAKKNPRQDVDKLFEVIEQLAEHGSLADEFHPHPLSNNWKPKWDCHIQPDFLLIYEVTEEELRLDRCGSHSELF